ncbi:MAG: AAA family ATPase [Thermoleophilia bacterium]|nr:AAA family ATPase [Thermoleophilia bacterium]
MRRRQRAGSAEAGAAGRDLISLAGRARELEAVEVLLNRAEATACGLVLEGEAGIGKTVLWAAGVAGASERGLLVLSCRPAEPEASLAYVALADLLESEPTVARALARLPSAHAAAITGGVLRLGEATFEEAAIDRALLGLVRELPAGGPAVIAIDDVQWLDPPSERALAFLLRRASDLPLRLLLARRSDGYEPLPLGLERAPIEISRLRVGPLSAGELDEVVRARLGLQLRRPALVELHRASGGNPFYALEIVKAAAARSPSPSPDDLRVPPALGELLAGRIAALSHPGREVALLAAAATIPSADQLERIAGTPAGLEEAIGASILALDGPRVRFTHPLLGSVAYDSAAPWERREAHRRLAAAARDPVDRALHVAAATDESAEAVAAELEEAARLAARRGAPATAARLAEHTLRLMPPDCPDAASRGIAAAEYHTAAGDATRARELLGELASSLPAGPRRAEVLYRLADAVGDDLGRSVALCRQALEEAGDAPALVASIEVALSVFTWLAGDLRASLEHTRAAAAAAERAGGGRELAIALAEAAHAEAVLGVADPRRTIAPALELERGLEEFPPNARPSFQLGIICLYTDALTEARPLLEAELRRAGAAGDEAAQLGARVRLADLELRAGNLTAASDQARIAEELARQAGSEQEHGVALAARALVDAVLGSSEAAIAAGLRALGLAEAGGDRIVAMRARGALGFAELSRGQAEAAHGWLGPAVETIRALGIRELSIQGVVENEIDALVALGRLGEAEAVVSLVEERSRPVDRAWGLAVAARGRAQLLSARGDHAGARAALAEASSQHARLDRPFELARTLLAAGAVERRAKRWAAARERLTEALELFDALGAPLWAERAAGELARIPGRRRSGGELTETERRVAELAATGQSNAEIAAALFVTVRAVEANLTRIYAKLGVRSRTELAARLAPEGPARP